MEVTAFVVDYAWGRPTVTGLRNMRVVGVMRYLSHDSTGKNLDANEVTRLSDAGIAIGVVWEQGAQDMLKGYSQGLQDGKDAAALAHSLGMPEDRPIYFAADWDVSASELAACLDYLHGAADAIGKSRTGVYGGYRLVHAALNAGFPWGWQTYGWSGNAWDPRAQIQQYSNDHTIDGVGVDYNHTTQEDWGQWRKNWTPNPNPQPNGEIDVQWGEILPGTIPTCVPVPPGTANHVSFSVDNGKVNLPAQVVRMAEKVGSNNWHVTDGITVDSHQGTVTHQLQNGTTEISFEIHEDTVNGKNVAVGFALYKA